MNPKIHGVEKGLYESFQEIAKLVLDPKVPDLKNRITKTFIIDFLCTTTNQDIVTFSIDDIIVFIQKRYKIQKYPPQFIETCLKDMVSANELSCTNDIYNVSNIDLDEIISLNDNAKEKHELFINSIYDYVQKNVGKLDDYQKVFVKKSFEKIFFLLLRRVGDSALVFLTRRRLSCNVNTLEEIVKDSVDEIRDPIIENAEKIKRAIYPSIKEILISPNREIADGLAHIGSIYVMLRILNVDPELKTLQKEFFKDTSVFLDTNILLALICEGSEHHKQTKWLLDSTKHLDVSIKVSNRTIEELHSSIRNAEFIFNRDSGRKISKDSLNNEIVRTFYRLKSRLNNWKDFSTYLNTETGAIFKSYNIGIIDINNYKFDETVYHNVLQIVSNELTKDLETKPTPLIEHDALNLLLIQELRIENPKAGFSSPWFLTRDFRLRRSDHKSKIRCGFEYESSIGCDAWFEIIYPFLSPEIDEDVSSLFVKMIGSNMMHVSPISIGDFISYISNEIQLPSKDERIILEIIEASHLKSVLENAITSGNLVLAVDSLFEIIGDASRHKEEMTKKDATISRLVDRNKELSKKLNEPEGLFNIDIYQYEELLDDIDKPLKKDEKGKVLEFLTEYLFSCIDGWKIVGRRKRTKSSELDLIIENLNIGTPLLKDMGLNIPVECKNWETPVGASEIRDFGRDIQVRRFSYGILISKNGITGNSTDRKDAYNVLWDFFKDRVSIIVLSKDDFIEIKNGKNLVSILREKDRELKLMG